MSNTIGIREEALIQVKKNDKTSMEQTKSTKVASERMLKATVNCHG